MRRAWIVAGVAVLSSFLASSCGLLQPRDGEESLEAQEQLIIGGPGKESESTTTSTSSSTTSTIPLAPEVDSAGSPTGRSSASPVDGDDPADGGTPVSVPGVEDQPVVDPALFAAADPRLFPPLSEPVLESSPGVPYPNAPEFCAAGVSVAQMGGKLLELPASTPVERVRNEVRLLLHQVGRAVSLAPPEISGAADQVRWMVIREADNLNSVRSQADYRAEVVRILGRHTAVEGALNTMVAYCGGRQSWSFASLF